jgi:hypothetical protein
MWMMQVAVNQVVKVTAVRNELMRTVWATMDMVLVMSTTLVTRRTSIRICCVDFKDVFVNVVGMYVL